jgi:hypothetical protein
MCVGLFDRHMWQFKGCHQVIMVIVGIGSVSRAPIRNGDDGNCLGNVRDSEDNHDDDEKEFVLLRRY